MKLAFPSSSPILDAPSSGSEPCLPNTKLAQHECAAPAIPSDPYRVQLTWSGILRLHSIDKASRIGICLSVHAPGAVINGVYGPVIGRAIVVEACDCL